MESDEKRWNHLGRTKRSIKRKTDGGRCNCAWVCVCVRGGGDTFFIGRLTQRWVLKQISQAPALYNTIIGVYKHIPVSRFLPPWFCKFVHWSLDLLPSLLRVCTVCRHLFLRLIIRHISLYSNTLTLSIHLLCFKPDCDLRIKMLFLYVCLQTCHWIGVWWFVSCFLYRCHEFKTQFQHFLTKARWYCVSPFYIIKSFGPPSCHLEHQLAKLNQF